MKSRKYFVGALAILTCLGFCANHRTAKETIAEHRFTQSEMDEIVAYVPFEKVEKVKNKLGSTTPNAYVSALAEADKNLNTVLYKKYNIKVN